MRDADYRVAGFIYGAPSSSADARQDCSAVSRAFFSLDQFHFVTINVRLNLPPQIAARSAAA